MEDIEKNLIDTISEIIKSDSKDICMESDLVEDLRIDSLESYEIAYALEETYKIRIPDMEINGFKKVQDIYNCLVTLVDKNSK